MEGDKSCSSLFQRCKPYIAMICLQFGFAGMNIITKVSLNRGMSHYVLVVYRHAFATAAIAPFAIVLERKIRPRITFLMFMQMFVLGLLGPVIDQNLYYAGLKFTSPTYSCAISNILPAMIFCNGCYFQIKGSILLIIATFAWSSFFILQAVTLRQYSAQLSLTAINIGLDMNLLAAAYAGIISSGLTYYVQGIVMQKKGPVFVTAFSPLMMIIVAIMATFILAEKLYLEGVIGAILIVIGLYSVLWGKNKENKEIEAETKTERTECCVKIWRLVMLRGIGSSFRMSVYISILII
ncbi:unnamed protein product [Vicia faba]|uniref:WAT1-related protein n=1 Tax=Vicia faba TaxID=3906 RepID=A0AAV0ZBA2_VICFA|nr:unnamed protein product [Vicia faba]